MLSISVFVTFEISIFIDDAVVVATVALLVSFTYVFSLLIKLSVEFETNMLGMYVVVSYHLSTPSGLSCSGDTVDVVILIIRTFSSLLSLGSLSL